MPWSHRWDVYMRGNPDDEIHIFAILNSIMIVLFLSGVVAMILLRTLRKDISSYNEMQTLEEAQEESGWKLVHGDVFRPPSFSPMLLSVLAGDDCSLFHICEFSSYSHSHCTQKHIYHMRKLKFKHFSAIDLTFYVIYQALGSRSWRWSSARCFVRCLVLFPLQVAVAC